MIYKWLVKYAGKYGFGQPYTSGRDSGYNEEKWHWSYLPLAKQFLQAWNTLYLSNPSAFNRKNLFMGSEYAGHLAPVYVNSISRECK